MLRVATLTPKITLALRGRHLHLRGAAPLSTTAANNASGQFKETYGAFIDGKEIIPANATFFDVEDPARNKKLCR